MYTRISLILKKTQKTAAFLPFCTLPEKIRNIRIVAWGIIKPVMEKFGNFKSFGTAAK